MAVGDSLNEQNADCSAQNVVCLNYKKLQEITVSIGKVLKGGRVGVGK